MSVPSQVNNIDMFLKAMTMMCDTMKQITERQMTASTNLRLQWPDSIAKENAKTLGTKVDHGHHNGTMLVNPDALSAISTVT